MKCPECGNQGEATLDSKGAFEVRGQFEGKAVRKCNRCGAGLMVGFFGKPKAISKEIWARMDEMWQKNFPADQ